MNLAPSRLLRRLKMALAITLMLSMRGPVASAGEPVVVQMATDMSLSPDGKTLAFVWDNDLWSVSTEGGNATRLTTDSAKDTQPKFSPDGQRIAFVSDRTGSDQIYVMAATGGLPSKRPSTQKAMY